MLEITAFLGRSLEAKKKLLRIIADNLAKDPGIDGEDVIIVIIEPQWATGARRQLAG